MNRTHIVVQPTSKGLAVLSDAQPEQIARNVARDLPGARAVKFDEIGNTMNTTQQTTAVLRDLYITDAAKACRKALSMTRNIPWKQRLDAINDLLGMHGTEAIRGEWQNGYWCDIVAAYCNAGDTYALTVVHVRGDGWNPQGRFIVTSWGDWVERNSEKYGIQ